MVPHPAFKSTFRDFIIHKEAVGLSRKTLETYVNHYNAICRYISPDTPLGDMTGRRIERVISRMADTGLSPNTIRSYTATLKSFFSWARSEGLTETDVRLYRGVETAPELYSDDELKLLIRKPRRGAPFAEVRAWAIINTIIDTGMRAGSVRAMQVRDVDLDRMALTLRHTKRRKVQVLPVSPQLHTVLSYYLARRGGEPEDPLFPDVYGNPLSENALRHSIVRYNQQRGVDKTSIHAFRHTFARMYLVDCGGDPLRLQKMLGHETLDMTKHYARMFDTDIAKDFEKVSPLRKLSGKKERIK